jgi:hypothetical protein
MTQRTGGFQGGIQAGTSATSEESSKLEVHLRKANQMVRPLVPSLTWKSGYSHTEIATAFGYPNAKAVGFRPDGGVWFQGSDPAPLMASEAKKQGPLGNAIERWYKNLRIAEALGNEVYLTVCTGEGFFNDRSAQACLETAILSDPAQAHRAEDNTIWNHPVGSIWLYRYESAEEATDAVLAQLVQDALAHATTLRAARAHS